MVAAAYSREEILWWLGQVADPEIPVLSITDLGIVRDVEIGETVTVALAPTYSGCPATEVIEHSVLEALREHGIEHAEIRRVLSPPWTTDWISEEGREKLREYGIAPPQEGAGKRALRPESVGPDVGQVVGRQLEPGVLEDQARGDLGVEMNLAAVPLMLSILLRSLLIGF